MRGRLGWAGRSDAGPRLEASMKALRALVVVACLIAVGCEEDPARKVKIEAYPQQQPASVPAQPSQPASTSATAAPPHSMSPSPAPRAVAQAPARAVKAAAHP